MKIKQVSEHKLRRYLDHAVDDGTPIPVTRDGGKGNVVILPETDFRGWQETVRLLSTPANASRLLQSIREADAGQMQERDLIDPELSRRR
jgi:antitoxin YefM